MKKAFLEKLIGKMDRLDPKSLTSIVSSLVEETGFLQTIFNALEEGVMVLGSEFKVLYFNQASQAMLGFPKEFEPGDSAQRYMPEEFWKTLEEKEPFKKSGSAVHYDVEVFYPQHRFLQIYVTPLEGIPRKGGYTLLILRDVTEAHRRAALTMESERTGAVTTLAAGVAHEIGNPLNSLHIHMQLIERELKKVGAPVRKKLEEHLQVCTGEIARLDQIVSKFLKAVRPRVPVLERHSINDILLDVLKVLEPEISNRDVLVEKELDADLPKVLVDIDQIKQVFFNLIRNSLQAMTKGGILHVRTQVRDDRLMIAIRDTGGGIPPEVIQHIFEPYFTTKNEGSGLGLMIVQRVVREHGGLIDVSSEQGRGTTFRILLPIAEKRTRLLEGPAKAA